MAWFPDWELRKAWVERNGLPVIFAEARVTADGFVALYLEADESILPRSHVSRGFKLHVSLGFRNDYAESVAEMVCECINAVWSNRYHVLDIEWVGKVGAAMVHLHDLIRRDPLITYLHVVGYYRARQLHVSL